MSPIFTISGTTCPSLTATDTQALALPWFRESGKLNKAAAHSTKECMVHQSPLLPPLPPVPSRPGQHMESADISLQQLRDIELHDST